MRGLLYKEYMAIGGRSMILGGVLLSILEIVFCIVTCFNAGAEVLLVLYTPMFFFSGVSCVMLLMSKLFRTDSAKNCRNYLLTMPIDKKEYIASKYIFYLIIAYAVLSWGILLSMIGLTALKSEAFVQMVAMLQLIAPIVICLLLIAAALAFPLYFLFGKKKGDIVFHTISVSLALVFLVWFLFGDISVLVGVELEEKIDKMMEYSWVFILLNALFPIVTGVIYYLSYRLTASIFIRKEREYDE